MKNIVVLGTGLTGMPLIRQTMRNTVLPSSNYKLIAISPSDHFFWPLAMPRAVVPGQFADDKIFYPLAPAFKDFPADKFEFVLGSASAIEPDNNTVRVGDRNIEYHTLIVATGTSTRDGLPWKLVNDARTTKKALHKIQTDIAGARSVAVIGGGVTGAETAGELGYEYARTGKKDIHFIFSGELPLQPNVLDKVRKQTVTELERLNVKLLPNTKVIKTSQDANGKTVLELRKSDGSTETMTVGTALHTTGVVPNTSFMPPSMLNENGFIKQDGDLRATGHRNIFIAGDAGSLDPATAAFAAEQTSWLVKHLPAYFASSSGDMPSEPYRRDGVAPINREVLIVGKERGVGHLGGWRLPSLLIWWIKARHLGTNYAEAFSQGKRTVVSSIE